jgi:hypothetical protein
MEIDELEAIASGKPRTEKPKDFWVMVALDFDGDEAWILAASQDVRDCDLVDGSAVSDSIRWDSKGAVPGLYKLTLKPWARADYEGVYDSGVDVDRAELVTAFPQIR